MIVSCPSCTTRYDIGAAPSDGPVFVSCRHCGHRWKELPMIEVEDVPVRNLPKVVEHEDEPQLDVQRLVEAAQQAKLEFVNRRRLRARRLAGWASFGFCAVIPFLVAAWVPETVVSAAPYTIKAYERLGYQVNVYGLDIRRIEQQNRLVDGAHVLMVKGEVSNPTNEVRKIPWLRFALSDEAGKELYSWTLDTASRPLRPGETTAFTTRIAAPPELAKNLQIRFAHLDEIGSNANP
ncbi:MAG: FxLYD domain-containing protein [Alphaproteobacteria bacterium]|nr:FxLYD domain-containing protein [Alphaproteobacteria bacterium]